VGHGTKTNDFFPRVLDTTRFKDGNRHRGESPRFTVLMDMNNFDIKKSIYEIEFGNHNGCLNQKLLPLIGASKT